MTFAANMNPESKPICLTQRLKRHKKRRFPTWHFSMMNDRSRNQAMFEAIDAIDLCNKSVFEIGTGAGLVAMYFARKGAQHVYTCEVDSQLYDLAVQTISQNGLSDLITVVHASSTDYIRSPEFDFSPDVIFTETLDCGVIGEGYMRVAEDILTIARKDTIVLPSEIRQYGFLVSSKEIAEQNCVSTRHYFDFSAINDFSTKSYFPVRYQLFTSKALSHTYEMRRHSYLEEPRNAGSFTMQSYASGTCHGVISFFHAQFGNSVVSNDVRDNSHWHQAFHPFPEPISVKSGDTLKLVVCTDGSLLVQNN